jgi:hypothetical protein
MTKIEEIQNKMNAARAEMRALGQGALMESMREVTKDLPNGVQSIGWQQYTDYFNDGDECTFSVRADAECMEFNGVPGYNLEDENTGLYNALFERVSGKSWRNSVESVKAVEKFLAGNEEFLKEAIGDHIKVTYHREHAEGGERIVVDGYRDHD